jgi:hypothetical protein
MIRQPEYAIGHRLTAPRMTASDAWCVFNHPFGRQMLSTLVDFASGQVSVQVKKPASSTGW